MTTDHRDEQVPGTPRTLPEGVDGAGAPDAIHGREPSTASRLKALVEVCGRHPFATGLFAILGVVGLAFSIYTFVVDRSESQESAKKLDSVTEAVHGIGERIIDIGATQSDEGVSVPIRIDFAPGDGIDNVVFRADDAVVSRDMDYDEAIAAMQVIVQSGDYSSSAPYYSFSVSSIADKHFVQIAPYLLVDVGGVRPIEKDVATIFEPGRGAGAELREFTLNLLPEAGVQVAPMIDGETGEYENGVDFISLQPGEVEEFFLTLSMLPDYYYDFRIGLQIKFKGSHSVVWSDRRFHRGFPSWEIPVYDFGSTRFESKAHPEMEYTEIDGFLATAAENVRQYGRSRVFKLEQVGLGPPVTPADD